MKKLFFIYIVLPLFLFYGGIFPLLWNDLNRFLHKKYGSVYFPDLFNFNNYDAFWTFLYFSFFTILLYVLVPRIVEKAVRGIEFLESKCKILTRLAILMLQYLCICGVLYIYYYYTRKHDCTNLLYPGKCGCVACSFREEILLLYTWIIFYAFIAEPIYNFFKKYLPEFDFKFDRKFLIMLVCSGISLFIILMEVLEIYDHDLFALSLNFDFGGIFDVIFMLPIIYIIACGYNVFLTRLDRRGKITNTLLILAFVSFPYLFPFAFCILDYILRKKNIKIAHFN